MRIPSKPECFQMMHAMEMMDHIVAHSLMVCRVARLLVDQMAAVDIILDRKLVLASSLLHDITKTRSFSTGENHARTGEGYLVDRGFPEVGDIVGQHVRLREYAEDTPPTVAEVVNYADKRVLHDKVVPLQERMDYIVERYGKNSNLDTRIQWVWEKTRIQETKLFGYLPISPDALVRFIGPEMLAADLAQYHRMLGRPRNPSLPDPGV